MSPASSGASLDLAFLDRQTFGDRELQGELLRLFDGQCARLLPCIEEDADPEARIAAVHTLKGSASAVGAHRVVALADALEDAFARGGEAARSALVTSLWGAVADARTAIRRWRDAV